jgi:hypothetical protein
MSNKTILMSAAAAIAALALSGSAFAAGQQGITVVKDAATGQLRAPTAEEAQQLRTLGAQQKAAAAAAGKGKLAKGASAAATVAPGTTTYHPNGAVEVALDEESLSYSVMTIDADGNQVLQCVTGATAAAKAMSTPATTHSKEHQHDVK